jgi:hypothetical protein
MQRKREFGKMKVAVHCQGAAEALKCEHSLALAMQERDAELSHDFDLCLMSI